MLHEAKASQGSISEIQFEIAKLTLHPGDVLVVRLLRGGTPSMDYKLRVAGEVEELLSKAGHPGTKVLVLGKNMALEVLAHSE